MNTILAAISVIALFVAAIAIRTFLDFRSSRKEAEDWASKMKLLLRYAEHIGFRDKCELAGVDYALWKDHLVSLALRREVDAIFCKMRFAKMSENELAYFKLQMARIAEQGREMMSNKDVVVRLNKLFSTYMPEVKEPLLSQGILAMPVAYSHVLASSLQCDENNDLVVSTINFLFHKK